MYYTYVYVRTDSNSSLTDGQSTYASRCNVNIDGSEGGNTYRVIIWAIKFARLRPALRHKWSFVHFFFLRHVSVYILCI